MRRTPMDKWISSKISKNPLTENLSQTEVDHYQLEKLSEIIDYVKSESPFYKANLRDLPGKCLLSLDDMRQFPFTSAEDLQDRASKFICVSQSEVQRVVTLRNPGVDPKTRRLYFTADDVEQTIDFFHHGMSTIVEPGQRVLILMPGDRPDTVGDLLVRALERMDVEGIVYGFVHDPANAIREIVRQQIDVVVGVPTNTLSLARHPESHLIGRGRIKNVLLSSDYVSPAIVSEFERVWSCSVFNHYGSTEMGFGGGVECNAFCGYHMREADMYFEIVDPDSGESKGPGEPGEVVFTTFTRKAMPLIRYRTGDLSRSLPGPCPCGSPLRRLERVRGRICDFVRLGGNHWLGIPDLDDALFGVNELIEYQSSLTCRNNETQLDVIADAGTNRKQYVLENVRQALTQAMVLKNAIEDGSISIGAVVFGAVRKPESSSSKRTILDQRS